VRAAQPRGTLVVRACARASKFVMLPDDQIVTGKAAQQKALAVEMAPELWALAAKVGFAAHAGAAGAQLSELATHTVNEDVRLAVKDAWEQSEGTQATPWLIGATSTLVLWGYYAGDESELPLSMAAERTMTSLRGVSASLGLPVATTVGCALRAPRVLSLGRAGAVEGVLRLRAALPGVNLARLVQKEPSVLAEAERAAAWAAAATSAPGGELAFFPRCVSVLLLSHDTRLLVEREVPEERREWLERAWTALGGEAAADKLLTRDRSAFVDRRASEWLLRTFPFFAHSGDQFHLYEVRLRRNAERLRSGEVRWQYH